ncbi:MAG TPA: hypothetical protein PLM75_03775 [bacterium]|nr:hypothetical protein [bacterium]
METSKRNGINKVRKKKIKKASFKVQWERFKERYPRMKLHLIIIVSGVIFTLILLTLLFFRKLDEYKKIGELF